MVAHNRISNVADGMPNGTYNIDVFGNDIFDTSDDGFEGDPGGPNIRVWGNRIQNAAHNGISYQPRERLAVVHPEKPAGRLHGNPVQVPNHGPIGHRAQHDRDVGTDVLGQRRPSAVIDREEQLVGVGVRRTDLGFRIGGQGLALISTTTVSTGAKARRPSGTAGCSTRACQVSGRHLDLTCRDAKSITHRVSRRSTCPARRLFRFPLRT